MGSCLSSKTMETTLSERESFDKICESCIQEYGHQDGYNGTLSTCNLVRIRKNTEKYSQKQEKAIRAKIKKEEDEIDKGDAYCYDFGIVGYLVSTITLENITNKPQYKKGFQFEYYKSGNRNGFVETKDSFNKVEAKKLMLQYAKKGYIVNPLKEVYILVSGKNTIASVKKTTKTFKTKPKVIKENQICEEIHKYFFIGLCFC